jgi:hypothetical protein
MRRHTTNFTKTQGSDVDPHVMWCAITVPWLQDLLYVLLIACEAAASGSDVDIDAVER